MNTYNHGCTCCVITHIVGIHHKVCTENCERHVQRDTAVMCGNVHQRFVLSQRMGMATPALDWLAKRPCMEQSFEALQTALAVDI